MTTSTHQTPEVDKPQAFPRKTGGDGGGIIPSDGSSHGVMNPYSPHPASTGIYVGLAAISMTFAALTSALVVRKGGAVDWTHFTLPSILYLNTIVILSSSVALEMGRRSVSTYMVNQGQRSNASVRWMYITAFLGLLFVVGQCIGWLQLRRVGLYLPTTPSSSFYYVLTVAHALHVLGGLGGLVLVVHRLKHLSLRKSTFDAVSRYWHFVGVLWAYLLWLLWMNI